MAESAATMSIKIVPDMSAFRCSEAHEIVSAIAADLPDITLEQLIAVAEMVVRDFSVLPKK
jgi:hypothetical protein